MISVIVPVYNVEKYIDKCVQSILNQTYTDFELILVDDGSTDKSGEMCDEYAKLDRRIVVVHKENGGPSEARNVAALKAKGEYITFVDSDDYVDTSYLLKLYSAMMIGCADICAVLMITVNETETVERIQNVNIGANRVKHLTGRDALLNVLYQKDLDTTPCGMLFRRSIVIGNPFPIGRYHEDDFTMYKYFESAQKVIIDESIGYYYVQHKSSIMHKKTKKIMMDEIEASDNLEKHFCKKDNGLLKAARSKKFSNYCQIFINYREILKSETDIESKIMSFLRKESRNVLFDKQTRIKNKIAAFIVMIHPRFLLLISNFS